jgi:hypothetical protein
MNTYVDVAFGDDPGRWPLRAATTPQDLWLRAVAAGGQGRYASAFADLDALDRSRAQAPLASLSLSTRASFLRQLGGHHAARDWDGRAWSAAGTDAEAGADALIGLAADALGVGRFALSRGLLRRAGELLDGGEDGGGGRVLLRFSWVSSELAMFTGNGALSVEHAESAVRLAAPFGSARHVMKSQVVLAAALCSAGHIDACRQVADVALAGTEELGLVPLSWALGCLLTDIGSSVHPPQEIRSARDGFADVVRRRGGTWTAR